MRSLLLLAAALAIAGCGPTDARSVPAATATPDDFISPIYPAPIDVVQAAVVRACFDRFGGVSINDLEAHRVEVRSSTNFAGVSHLIVTLSTNADGKTVADIWSHGSPEKRVTRDVQQIISYLALEMSRVPEAAKP